MVQSHRTPAVYTVILLLLLQASLEAKKLTKNKLLCPIGFKLTYTKSTGEPICYRLKGPEKVTDTFKDCSGNLYTAKLYDDLEITNHTEQVLWTEYKSAYPGGPFVDSSFTPTVGSLLRDSFDLSYESIGLDEEACIIKDPIANYAVDRCDKEYYRYCLVEPYPVETLPTEGCGNLREFFRFWSPKPICLTIATSVSGGSVRATWAQSNEICEKRGGQILYSGWRYSNSPLLHVSETHNVYPLRVTYDPSHNVTIRHGMDFVLWHCGGWAPYRLKRPVIETFPCTYNTALHRRIRFTDTVTVLRQPGVTNEQNQTDEVSFGALRNGIWDLVNSSYVFYDVICEKDVDVQAVSLIVKADEQNKLILTVDAQVEDKNIFCFTDSETFYPTPVKISFEQNLYGLLNYVLKPKSDGNYWCVHIDSKHFYVSESNKLLWIREEQSLRFTYAVKLYYDKMYTFETVEKISEIWEKKLKDYIYYSTNYYNVHGEYEIGDDGKTFQNVLKEFKDAHPELTPKENDVIYGMKIKKIYLDRKSATLHFQLNPMMKPVPPGWWNNMKIIYMKPVFYCTIGGHLFVDERSLGCQFHTCVGNFNDGVQVVTQSDEGCQSKYNLQVTISMPTVMPDERVNPKDDVDLSDSSEENQTVTTELTTFTSVTVTTESTTEIDTTTGGKYPTRPPPPVPTLDTVITAVPTFPTQWSTPTPLPTTEIPTTLPPQEQLALVMQDLESLVKNDTAEVTVDAIAGSFDRVDELLSENMALDIPGELLHLLDGIGARMELNGSSDVQTVRGNLALLVADAAPDFPVNGIRIAARENDTFTDNAFEILRDQVNSDHLSSASSEAVVRLPESVANSSRRISFVVFRTDRAFQSNRTYTAVNSRVLSINVENITEFRTGEAVDIHFNPFQGDIDRNQTRTCAFWKFNENGGGDWSQDGCRFIPATELGMLDTCRCEHLTHFAEILVPRTLFSEGHERALEIVSVVGCCISIFGLAMIGITAALFRSWRRDFSNKIWLQLCIAILILVLCFLLAVFAKINTDNIGCLLIGIALHYSVLASFCWMLVAAVLSYRRLVMVFTVDASHKLLRASAFAWGAPFIIIGILLSIAPQSYSGHFEEKTPTGGFCYPTGLALWLSVYTPIAIMLIANWVLFILIVRSVFASTRIQRHGDSNEALRCASVSCLLVFLFGLPWIFGLFAYNIVSAYLFAVTATLQGFVLFLFFVLGNKKTRDLWLNKLKIKQTRKIPVTSSTYTNRSTGPGWRGAASGTVEAKVSKPRSLASSDDSRFS